MSEPVMPPPYPSKAVANCFIELEKANPQTSTLTPMKLQKLLYFAHGWHLALAKGTALFTEPVEAWSYGPVVSDIYHEFKSFGLDPITEPATNIDDKLELTTPQIGNEEQDNQVKDFLAKIYGTYGKYTGVQLSNATHQPGSPWSVIREKCGENDRHVVIPNPLIQQYFEGQIKK
jgi:uncharacterized phage-associated protein